MEPIRIDSRFCGPPGSGNGGYVAGRLARYLDGASAVRLRVPPPLDTPLAVRAEGEGVEALHGEMLVASARPAELDLAPPAAPSFSAALAAARAFRGFEEHPFPGCFVCGIRRPEGDGLRIFPGPLPGSDVVATPWIPDASLDAGDGRVASEFVWAALDCPGAFAFPQPAGAVVVLGELAVRIDGPVAVGERCVVVGWPIADDGRKHVAGSALFGASGACRAIGRAVWIEIERL